MKLRISNLALGGFLALLAVVAALGFYFLPILEQGSVTPNGVPFEDHPGFIWTFRGIDVLVQGVIVLATMIAIASIFRPKVKEGREEIVPEAGPTELPEGEEEDLT
jgi:hypothetical protein